MRFFVSLFKDIIAATLVVLRTLFVSKSSYVDDLKRDGYVVVPNYFQDKYCAALCETIASELDKAGDNIWEDSLQSDQRLYFIDRLHASFEIFFNDELAQSSLEAVTGTRRPDGFVVASRVRAADNNLGSGGGWHRDSPHMPQFKAIAYLNDVTENTGPFEYIPGSHSLASVIRSYFLRVFDAGQFRFSEGEIFQYSKMSKQEPIRIIGKAGTLVLVNTKGIHRGAPIIEGERFSMTSYYFDKIPNHLKVLNAYDN